MTFLKKYAFVRAIPLRIDMMTVLKGPHVQQQVPQSYNQQQMNSYPQQGMHNMQQAVL